MNKANTAGAQNSKEWHYQQAVEKMANRAQPETAAERVTRLCAGQGGALVGWLCDEARRRGQELQAMAREVGVTYGYINQLRSGLRLTENISQGFSEGCARYLGVPTIVVKIISGSIRVSDFAFPNESEDQLIDRAVRIIQDDPQVRASVPGELISLPLDARKALVAMYVEKSGRDLLGLRALPEMVRWLQRAAVLHAESEFEALAGHKDTSAGSEAC